MTGFMIGKSRALLLEPFELILPRQSGTYCAEADQADQAANIKCPSRACCLNDETKGGSVVPETVHRRLDLHSVAAEPHVSDLGPGLLGRFGRQHQGVMPHMVRVRFDEGMVD